MTRPKILWISTHRELDTLEYEQLARTVIEAGDAEASATALPVAAEEAGRVA